MSISSERHLILANCFIIALTLALSGYYWDDNLRADLLGSFLASTLALIVGVPVALHVNALHQRRLEAKQGALRHDEQAGQRARVIELLRQELSFNRSMLARRQRAVAMGARVEEAEGTAARRVVAWALLKTDFWRAISASGDIRHIHDMQILNAIAQVYYRLNITMMFERKYMDAALHPGPTGTWPAPGGRATEQKILEILSAADRQTALAIDEALAIIDDRSGASAPTSETLPPCEDRTEPSRSLEAA